MNRHIKKLDIWLLGVLPPMATFLVIFFELNYLQSILIFFLPTAIWFSLRNKKVILRSLIFAGIFTVPIALIVDYMAVSSGAWYVPNTVFPVRYLNILPLEDVVLGLLLVYSVIICFEHFLDKGRHNLIDHKMKYFMAAFALAIGIFLLVFMIKPEILAFKNSYVWLGLIFVVIPIITAYSVFPRLVSKYIKVGMYFALVLLMFEYAGVALDHWIFTSDGILGSVQLFDKRIPYEELVFWVLLGSTSIISYYEFFDDKSLTGKA